MTGSTFAASINQTPKENAVSDTQDLADRYVAAWNEPDTEARRRAIAALWAPGGVHYADVREAKGYDAIERRIVGSYEKSVRDGGHRFRAVSGARALRDCVTFFWEMLPKESETVVATGLDFLLLDGDGRILTDYQFVLAPPPAVK
jgi:hypothetical protein